MATERKPAPPGYERHALDPNLVRKVQPKSAAQSMYPYLPSNQQHRAKEEQKEKDWLARKEKWR